MDIRGFSTTIKKKKTKNESSEKKRPAQEEGVSLKGPPAKC